MSRQLSLLNQEQLYYDIKEAATLLRISETTVYRRIKDGVIPKAKYCGKVLIPAWFFKQALKGEEE